MLFVGAWVWQGCHTLLLFYFFIVEVILRVHTRGEVFAEHLARFRRVLLTGYVEILQVFVMLLQLSAARSQISRTLVAWIVVRFVVCLEHTVGNGGVATVVHRDGYAEENLVREVSGLQGFNETLYCFFHSTML